MMGAAQVRTIKPRLESDLCFKVHELVTGVMAFWLLQINQKPVTATAKLIYAENCVAEGMLGAYGIKQINPLTDQRSYTPVRSLNCWFDIHRKDEGPALSILPSQDMGGTKPGDHTSEFRNIWWDPGLFFGFGKNLGSSDCLINPADFHEFGFDSFQDVVFGGYSCKEDIFIDWLFRLAPRFTVHFKNFWIGIEAEWMRAMYGCVGQKAKVFDTHPVDNFRFLAAWYYFF